MKRYSNFALYIPEVSDDNKKPEGVLFLRSKSGVDWYEAQSGFQPDTMKVMYDSAGIICCAETDVSGLWPVNCSVAEISLKNVPEDFSCNGLWTCDGKSINKREYTQTERIAKNEATKSQLMSAATSAIAPLQDAVDIGLDTQEEAALLLAWKKYRALLNRVDATLVGDISWPEVPSSVA